MTSSKIRAPRWQAATEQPQHHELMLFPNYPLRPTADPDHLVMLIQQRTTGGPHSIRLHRGQLLTLRTWLAHLGSTEGLWDRILTLVADDGRHGTLTVLGPPLVDSVVPGGVLFQVDDYRPGYGRYAVVTAEQAQDLAAYIWSWHSAS